MPTYKAKYRTDIEGYCYNSKCETKAVTNICEQFECPYGCAEIEGIGNCYPKAVIQTVPGAKGHNVEISKGQSIVFDCSESYDPDGSIITCKWDFSSNEGSATGTVVTHTFNKEGSYTVKLTVTDSEGLTDTEEVVVNVVYTDWPPEACFTVTPSEGIIGITEFSFDASCSSDPDVALGDYITSYEWDFGDGYKGQGAQVKHVYTTKPLKDETSYEVKLVVKDRGYGQQRGLAAMDKKKVVVRNTAPAASFSATPREGKPPLEVIFKVLESDPDGHLVTYRWDFGDGSSAIGKEVAHTYKDIGEYTVTLTATDEYGASSTEKTTIKVYDLRGITTISAENVARYETTTIFVDCTGADTVDITIGKEASSVTKLAGVRCGTHVDYGPIAEEGTYTVVAQILDCNAPECVKTASFNVVPQPGIMMASPEVNPIFILIIALIVLGIVRWKNRNL
jgi:PKD repeat protein